MNCSASSTRRAPTANAARLDMRALGEQILERKKQLQRGVTILRPLAMDVRTITSGLQMHPLEAM